MADKRKPSAGSLPDAPDDITKDTKETLQQTNAASEEIAGFETQDAWDVPKETDIKHSAFSDRASALKKWMFKTKPTGDPTEENENRAPEEFLFGEEKPAKPEKPRKPAKTPEQLAKQAAQRKNFKIKIWEPLLRPVVVLVAICIITSLLLAITNEVTAPVIAQNATREADAARQKLLPAADGFTEVPLEGDIPNITDMYKANNDAGYIIDAYGQGYGGAVPVMVAFDENGNIAGVQFLENNETPGLGKKLNTDSSFAAQFAGMPNKEMLPNDIDSIANATISSNAAVTAINAAIALYNEQVLGAATGDMTPEEVRAMLLPDASTITELTIGAPGVAEAWKGDDGNYIIYGEANGIYGKPVTAAVAMNPGGVVLGVWVDTSGETEGYGQELAGNQAFLDSFVGKTAPVTVVTQPSDEPNAVDAVAGSTISCTAVGEAVNNALAALPTAKEAG